MFTKQQISIRNCLHAVRVLARGAAVLAGCLVIGTSVYANPEMDSCGRDISSGPLPGTCQLLAAGGKVTDVSSIKVLEPAMRDASTASCGQIAADDCSAERVPSGDVETSRR